MLFAGSDDPDYHVDIEPVLRKKLRAVLAHSSQMGARSEQEMLRIWRERARAQRGDADEDGRDPVFRESFRKQLLRR